MSVGPPESFNCRIPLATKTLLCIAFFDAGFIDDIEDKQIWRWKSHCDDTCVFAGKKTFIFSCFEEEKKSIGRVMCRNRLAAIYP
jgi:hypothetical protein